MITIGATSREGTSYSSGAPEFTPSFQWRSRCSNLSFLFDHSIVSPSLTYASDYPCGILWPLHCLSFVDLRLLITPVVSSNISYVLN